MSRLRSDDAPPARRPFSFAGKIAGLFLLILVLMAAVAAAATLLPLSPRELVLQTALDRSPAAIVLLNQNGRVIYSNREARHLLTGGAKLEGRSFSEIRDGSPEEMRQILDSRLLPFYSTKQTGSGLGLPLCREILEAHGGKLALQANEGGGTVVTCWLPSQLRAEREP